ncbi:MAG: Type II secretion system protein E [Parcubacteria group bacterium GW2011_GWA2_38_13]|nr:MAG: Type II secretion system protein E [Parcubacteria group bacterium GW2011_GWA2_38_13]
MLSENQIIEILILQKLITQPELKEYERKAKETNIGALEYLKQNKVLNENQIYQAIADKHSIPFTDLKDKKIRKDILMLIPEAIAQAHKIIAFDKDEKDLHIATLNPKDIELFDFLKKKTNLDVKIFITTPSSFSEALKSYHLGLQVEFGNIKKEQETGQPDPDNKDLKELAQDLPIIRIVDTLLEYAIFEGASDIHIEPEEKEVDARYRIDGILRNVMTLPKSVHAGIVARIKILSNLKLDEHRLPQDGRFKIQTNEYNVSFRVSIIPTFEGEKVVMRLLNEKGQLLTIEQLGFLPTVLATIKRNISKPHGMILVTGPTGSGKTTTLYTFLNVLNTPKVNITTIEDPIEYRMAHVNQSQVNPKIGYTFAAGLRAFLRQDPNIIMVGEIRDPETAEIAVHAAMTGHLVLSTLHTNDAITTLPRLCDMGIPSFLIANTTNIIIAQRLVRKICPKCIYSYTLDKKGVDELDKIINLKELVKTLEREKIISLEKQSLDKLLFYRGKGCKACNQEGFKGRIGIYEALEITPEISSLLVKKASNEELKIVAKKQSMISILEDGFIKAKNGVTTVEEILRVTKE